MYSFPGKISIYLRIIFLTKTGRARVDEKRIEKTEKKNAKPDLLQFNMPLPGLRRTVRQCYIAPTHRQRLQENMLLWLFLVLISNVCLECFATLVTKMQTRMKIKSNNKNE